MEWLDLEDVAEWIRVPGRAQSAPKGFPMFQTQKVNLSKKGDIGVTGRGSVLLAENVDTIWFVEAKDRKTPVSKSDKDRFLTIKAELEEIHPDKYIRGILLTSAPVSDTLKDEFVQEDSLLIHVSQSSTGKSESSENSK